jgi:predicted anti-sigma-YlaC factor YlaD
VSAPEAARPDCREVRMLLGVYVLGAIDRIDRPLVDEHLAWCRDCRDELAGLAPLPAMLGRVSLDEAERIVAAGEGEPYEPSQAMLDSLLRRVSRRRTRLWRGAVAVAAAAVIAAGTAAAVTVTRGGSGQQGGERVAVTSHSTHVVVDYAPSPWGTAMRVQVSGLKPGTACEFWVIGSSGPVEAGSWTVRSEPYGHNPWYAAGSSLSPSSVHGFELTSAGKVLVHIPAQ